MVKVSGHSFENLLTTGKILWFRRTLTSDLTFTLTTKSSKYFCMEVKSITWYFIFWYFFISGPFTLYLSTVLNITMITYERQLWRYRWFRYGTPYVKWKQTIDSLKMVKVVNITDTYKWRDETHSIISAKYIK